MLLRIIEVHLKNCCVVFNYMDALHFVYSFISLIDICIVSIS